MAVSSWFAYQNRAMIPATPRSLSDCPAGQLWYTCAVNSFHGCCSIDPCSLEGCPTQTTGTAASSSTQSQATSVVTITSTDIQTFSTHSTSSLSTPIASKVTSNTVSSSAAPIPQAYELSTVAAVVIGAGGMLTVLSAIGAGIWICRKVRFKTEPGGPHSLPGGEANLPVSEDLSRDHWLAQAVELDGTEQSLAPLPLRTITA